MVKLIYLVILLSVPSYAQQPLQHINNNSWFDQIIGIENSGVISGTQYKMKILGKSTDPFFTSATNGTVRYKHKLFEVSLLYDIYQDEIVVQHQNAVSGIWFVQLDKKVVQEFMIGNHLFRKIDGDFYEVIFEGSRFSVLLKRSKMSQVRKGIVDYVTVNRFYLVQSGNWKELSSIANFSKIIVSKEENIAFKSFLRQNHIRTRRFQDAELVRVATFVNGLLE